MKMIVAFIRPEKLTMTKDSLEEHGCEWSISVSEIMGHGHQKGVNEVWKGKEFNIELLPKIKIEIVVADEDLDKTVQGIMSASQTGSIGDGKIFVSDINNAYRIRTGEQGDIAI